MGHRRSRQADPRHAFVESFDGRLRDGCLDGEASGGLAQARPASRRAGAATTTARGRTPRLGRAHARAGAPGDRDLRRPPVIGCRAAGPPSRPRVWVPTEVQGRAGAGHRAGGGAFVRGSGKASAGVRHPRHVRGVASRRCWRAPRAGSGIAGPSVSLGRGRRSRPWVVSMAPFCQGAWGSQTQARAPRPAPGSRQETNASPRSKGRLRRGGQGRERVDEAAHDGLRAAVVVWEAHGAAGRPLHRRGPVRAPVLAAHDREVPLTCARTRRDPSPRQADGERPHDHEGQGFRASWNDEAGGACDGWAGAGRAPRSVACGSGRTGGSSRGTAVVGPRARRAAARRSARASRHHGADPRPRRAARRAARAWRSPGAVASRGPAPSAARSPRPAAPRHRATRCARSCGGSSSGDGRARRRSGRPGPSPRAGDGASGAHRGRGGRTKRAWGPADIPTPSPNCRASKENPPRLQSLLSPSRRVAGCAE